MYQPSSYVKGDLESRQSKLGSEMLKQRELKSQKRRCRLKEKAELCKLHENHAPQVSLPSPSSHYPENAIAMLSH